MARAENNAEQTPKKRGGGFKKGQSGNPGGRPKVLAEWRKSDEAQRLRGLSYKALEQAVQLAQWKDRIAAARELLDRIEGRPTQALTDAEGQALRIGVIVLPAEGE